MKILIVVIVLLIDILRGRIQLSIQLLEFILSTTDEENREEIR